jgi:excisionase family DNA binding protein
MSLDELPDVLTVEEAAHVLRIGRSAAYAAVAAGQIPALRLGRKLRISRAAIERMLAGE